MRTKFLIPLIAGLGLLWACKGKTSSESADSVSAPASVTKEKVLNTKSDTIQNAAKLVKTADIRFKVKNVQQTSERIADLTTSLNGTVIHNYIHSTTSDSTNIQKSNDSLMKVTVLNITGEMTVKIPPGNLETFVSQVTRMGIYIDKSKMDITDKSLDYLATRLKLKNQNDLVNQQKKGDSADPKSPDNMLAFKNNMVDQQIGNRKIDDSVKNSVVTLSFYENNIINKELVANNNLSAYNMSFGKRLGMSIENGWNVFVDVFVFLANLWIIVPIGLIIWLFIRYYKNKKTAAMVKS
ncbi:DUF4349 domain-containing protein [Mucilaginibacter sp. X4EP1]|uniref:DUF4349 domain-containing protein n=1 Tax=Mucilaginibacter sp. X4EP1 TaxID=2723092 RepID=UPI002166C20A|nr:DUF4349 domain-containing protein [Mucilaginibacter sp. X4EP1]MCS3813672.1 type IV secretory pathway TrbD component [Mucilaginibacter sp. X4EP1]